MATVTSEVHPALAALDREQRELLAGLHEDLHAVAATPALVTAWAMLWLDRVPSRGELVRCRERIVSLASELSGMEG